MCTDCGCGVQDNGIRIDSEAATPSAGIEAVNVLEHLLADNDRQAEHNRAHLDRNDILAINLMSSPGSGKTALLEATIKALRDEVTIAVIEGDLETENDAARIRRHGVAAIQISTGNGCHLDAAMVHKALHRIDLVATDLLFIENVGNLVCPASFDLGQHRNVTLLSVPEGDDKPAKYPVIFRAADMVLVSKTDLAPFMPAFSFQRARQHLQALATTAPVLTVSATTGAGMAEWLSWLRDEITQHHLAVRSGETVRTRTQPEGVQLHASRGV